MADDLTAALEEIKTRSRWTSSADGIAAPGATAVKSARDVPRLLAAVDAVLKAAAGWQRYAAEGDAQDECAREVRKVILAALTGEGESGGTAAC